MSAKHLGRGDEKPAFNNSKEFRIYSMKFCPFAQRPRLVAAAKGLTNFDIVNIKLLDYTPEWYTSINPLHKAPAIEFPDGEAIYESLIVSDLLDDLYPEKRLHPKDPKEKARQKLFIDRFGNTPSRSKNTGPNVINLFVQFYFLPSYFKYFFGKSEENKEELQKNISKVEEQFAEKKSKYFAGKEAGMIDFMLWPWFERLPTLLPLSADLHPNLTNWFNLMHEEPAVKETAISKENYIKFNDLLAKGQPEYDFL